MRADDTIALLMIDADWFKEFNDRYGHQAGDTALQSIATCIRAGTHRPGDFAARYGGEEFVTILPGTDLTDALMIADRIRGSVAALDTPHDESPYGHLTVSIGVASIRPRAGDAEGRLLKMADQALYASKHAGRNVVKIAPISEQPRPDGRDGLERDRLRLTSRKA
jgi:diguanylate cyclase (GGDEF)-like protein